MADVSYKIDVTQMASVHSWSAVVRCNGQSLAYAYGESPVEAAANAMAVADRLNKELEALI